MTPLSLLNLVIVTCTDIIEDEIISVSKHNKNSMYIYYMYILVTPFIYTFFYPIFSSSFTF